MTSEDTEIRARPATGTPTSVGLRAASGERRRRGGGGAPGLAGGLLRTARPRQWIKNLLVFAAPGAAGALTDGEVMVRAVAAFAVFCVAASGTYFLNDALDVEADRLHPTKQRRPIASGVVPTGPAKAIGVVLLLASVGCALALGGWPLALIIGIYVALQPLYSLWLKNLAVIDLAAVASGFVLRAIAGGVAVNLPISQWFLIVASFGSLFMVAGKRHAEHLDLGDDGGHHRSTLGDYSSSFLHYVQAVSSAVAIAAYCLWAFEKADVAMAPLWFQLSIIPLVLAVLRYALLLDGGRGGAPEEIVLGDRSLQVLGLVWMATFAIGVHVR
ncbi:MAG: decaprenyl-phosphate phosphoribosyltransferase [Actinomycetota bacterium]|nr:decaprenyl-phosphate phosphoribosyltransferase [Actinomycetota bacterium]